MINVFETREVVTDNKVSWEVTLERVTDWRKGIAVARYYISSINRVRSELTKFGV